MTYFFEDLHTNKVSICINKVFLHFNLDYIKCNKIYPKEYENFGMNPRIMIQKQYYCDVERQFLIL